MTKKCALQMDAIENINIKSDSSFMLGLEAINRGYELYHYGVDDLYYEDGNVFAYMRRLNLKYEVDNHYKWLGQPEIIKLYDLDVIWIRQDPPFDMSYITNTHLLDLVKDKVKIFNNPSSIRNAPEKLLTTYYQDICAPTMITRIPHMVKEFRNKHKNIIIKPLYGNGGAGVFHIKENDDNISSLLSMFFEKNREPIIVQKYLPQVRDGDKRIILINGEPKSCINRIPADGEARANLHVGGKHEKSSLTENDKIICARIAPYLKEKGLLFVGIDVIGDYLTEINVTSPTCIQECNELYNLKIESDIWDSIEND
ncbi:glutathione synthase [Alphaproteobacteria bacterium]|nr:glutathione synthase [Alphaproteobacteria bacterium]